jgi:hypothetical protein
VHGEADNPGTFTLQTDAISKHWFRAPVRMVILPKRTAMPPKNILHLLWEQDQFLEKYLKN